MTIPRQKGKAIKHISYISISYISIFDSQQLALDLRRRRVLVMHNHETEK